VRLGTPCCGLVRHAVQNGALGTGSSITPAACLCAPLCGACLPAPAPPREARDTIVSLYIAGNLLRFKIMFLPCPEGVGDSVAAWGCKQGGGAST
jgi:hypothetical protein